MNAGSTNTRLPYRVKNIVGQKFGRLTVVKFAGVNKWRWALWTCRCDCGKKMVAKATALANGHTKSCGCLFRDTRHTSAAIHNGCLNAKPESEYYCWQGMMKRCFNKSHVSYAAYGGSGITIHPELQDYLKFKAHIGPRPSKNHSVDRFPNHSGNYEPGNIRWATRKEQQRNMKSNRLLTFNGETMPMSAWSERLGFSRSKLPLRLRSGWSLERAITTP
jgi:hypothetical protein